MLEPNTSGISATSNTGAISHISENSQEYKYDKREIFIPCPGPDLPSVITFSIQLRVFFFKFVSSLIVRDEVL